jgi:phage-related protein
MRILGINENNDLSGFEVFLNKISDKLATAISKKFLAYVELNDIYIGNSLKVLNPRIWGYKGTIYKLRVDCGKESARVLFVKTLDNDIVLLHGFIKKTRKTPKKDAKIAMENLERLKNNAKVTQLPLTNYSL